MEKYRSLKSYVVKYWLYVSSIRDRDFLALPRSANRAWRLVYKANFDIAICAADVRDDVYSV